VIIFTRFMQWWCVLFGVFDFAVGVWFLDGARWGYAVFEFANAAFMAFLWLVQTRLQARAVARRG
jgi:hypothetical protein